MNDLGLIDDVLDKSIADLHAICTYCPDFMKDCSNCGIEQTRQVLVMTVTKQINIGEEDSCGIESLQGLRPQTELS